MATTVVSAFDTLLGRQRLSTAQEETAAGRVAGLGAFFDRNFDMAVPVFAVGSYERSTICAGERDIDLMAPIAPDGASRCWERFRNDSRAFLYWVRDQLNARYGATKVSSRQVCVKLDFTQIVTDVAPCFPRVGGGYLMPDGARGWMATNPPYHAELITSANREHDWKLKPLIRLVKAWNIANGHHLSSFHTELMVEGIKRNRTIGNWPSEVAVVLQYLPDWVQGSFADPWLSGRRLDDYLPYDTRQMVIRMLESHAKAAVEAEKYRAAGKMEAAFKRWSVVYRHTFPSYG